MNLKSLNISNERSNEQENRVVNEINNMVETERSTLTKVLSSLLLKDIKYSLEADKPDKIYSALVQNNLLLRSAIQYISGISLYAQKETLKYLSEIGLFYVYEWNYYPVITKTYNGLTKLMEW